MVAITPQVRISPSGPLLTPDTVTFFSVRWFCFSGSRKFVCSD